MDIIHCLEDGLGHWDYKPVVSYFARVDWDMEFVGVEGCFAIEIIAEHIQALFLLSLMGVGPVHTTFVMIFSILGFPSIAFSVLVSLFSLFSSPFQ